MDWTRRWAVGFAVASAVAAVAVVPPAPAAGTTEEDETSSIEASTGACGSWWQETAEDIFSVLLCAVEGIAGVGDDRSEPGMLVTVYRHACRKVSPFQCSAETHRGLVDRGAVSIDPGLRRARILTTLDGCAIEAEFVGVSALEPNGGIGSYHSIHEGTPTVHAWAGQTITRQAHWWGRVCGRFLVADQEGQGHLWRAAGAGLPGAQGHGDAH
jgi:hypothetical protein